MTDAPDSPERDRNCAFFGSVTAGLSHELNNVFATINELSGLLGDLAAAGQRGRSMDPQRLESIAQRIAVQVERGQGQTKHLNRFAHSVDPQQGQADLTFVAQEVLALFTRVARLRKVELDSRLPAGPLPTRAEPFELYHLLWRSLDLGVEAVGTGGHLELEVVPAERGAELRIRSGESTAAGTPPADRLSTLAQLVGALGGELRSDAHSGRSFCLTVLLLKPPTRGGPGEVGP